MRCGLFTVGGIKTVTFPFRSVETERPFCVCRSITCTRPAYFRSVSVPFGHGLAPRDRVIEQASYLERLWLARLDRGPPIDRSVKKNLVRSPTCQAVYRWRLLRVVDLSEKFETVCCWGLPHGTVRPLEKLHSTSD